MEVDCTKNYNYLHFSKYTKLKIIPKSLLLLSFFALILIGCEKEEEIPNYETDTITDSRDGNIYKTVKIGEQWWMAENLKYLPAVSPPSVESNTDPYYYVYDYQGTSISEAKATANYTTYGVLYNWSAAMNGEESSGSNPSGVQGVCPSGWHLPSVMEWFELSSIQTSTVHWINPNTGATNETGFTAIPGGTLNSDGTFIGIGDKCFWWSSTDGDLRWGRGPNYQSSDYHWRDLIQKGDGLSVRCVKD